MRILIHCNSGPRLGVGHAIRSIALAEQALARGHEVVFAGVLKGELVRRSLAALDAEVIDLAPAPDLSVLVQQVAGDLAPDLLHVDSYDAGLRAASGALSRVEDGVFGRGRGDVVVDPTLGAERDDRPADGSRWLLRGSRYVPLRRAVVERRRPGRDLAVPARRVLVVMGGTDPQGLTPLALDALERTGRPVEITAVVGPDAVSSVQTPASSSVRLLAGVDDLPALLAEADVVVSAAGTSVWELCCLGTPMALVCAVDNQRPGYDRVLEAGAAVGLGSGTQLATAAAADRLRRLLSDDELRHRMSARATSLVDGLGSWRVVAAWEQQWGHVRAPAAAPAHWHVRPATQDDAEQLLRWRNDPVTRAASRSRAEVTWEDHVAWLAASLARDDRVLLLVADPAGAVGTVRWDRVGEQEWEVSITVAPERRGQGLARGLLESAEQALAARVPVPVWCLAAVHRSNAASRRLFLGAGYVPDAPADDDGFERLAKLRPGPR